MVALNHAIALAMVHGPAVGLERLDALAQDPRLHDHHRLAAVRAHLLERAGDVQAAIVCFERAAERTISSAEQNYLRMRAARVRARCYTNKTGPRCDATRVHGCVQGVRRVCVPTCARKL